MNDINMDLNVNLKGKTAVVTGGSGTLCSAIAKAFAVNGANVAIIARNQDKTENVISSFPKTSSTVKGYYCDVSDKQQLQTTHQNILKDFGSCDILLNGAGGLMPGSSTSMEYFKDFEDSDAFDESGTFWNMDDDAVRKTIDLNYLGTLYPMQVFSQDMVQNKCGCIINISSVAGISPLTKVVTYANQKSAIISLTKWAAVHFASSGIRCNAIAPGFYAAEQNYAMLFNPDGSPTSRTSKILASTPMKRLGKPDDLIGPALFLASNSAKFVTGTVIPVDGGFTAYSGV